ncbi:MAG: NYN domain-containing protein [Polyangiaceae bacterium]|nr:NYN domain-containing protein [Polyangiaceae bacterium]
MDRAAVFVDAGYIYAAGSLLVANQNLTRDQLRIDHVEIVKLLERLVIKLSGLPLLRIYWYDGARTGPTSDQIALAYLPNVKLRLGILNARGHQKGVDSLIVSDMINLARNHAMSDALLATGDEDMRVGVQQAQEIGVRVHLVGIDTNDPSGRKNQSCLLRQEADSTSTIGIDEVKLFLARSVRSSSNPVPAATPPSAVPPTPQTPEQQIKLVAKNMAMTLGDEDARAIVAESRNGSIPREFMDRLLASARNALSTGSLDKPQKRRLRAAFLDECRLRGNQV